jgi:hypothetical protein
MKLKAQVLLLSAAMILGFLGMSEALSFRQANEFFTQHEMRIRQGGESEGSSGGGTGVGTQR